MEQQNILNILLFDMYINEIHEINNVEESNEIIKETKYKYNEIIEIIQSK